MLALIQQSIGWYEDGIGPNSCQPIAVFVKTTKGDLNISFLFLQFVNHFP
ncbi:NADH-quinone oxidoreductase subunit H [Sporosarcina newyorkensis 2681]|uniref:NADH-quinone oxidoreductase subunit H n=1 Tax=Sporosarcina newyorkensis 2681 TaxID=1027292 RepID=F9DT88_9BACL|nr:NADH-quinone oxidoreductase subunit H [Sporosarcina newyorkensis 2681]